MNDTWNHVWAAVQAIGSILGIFAAVWVGFAAIRAENRRIAARGRVAAFRLAPDMVNIVGEVERATPAIEFLRTGLQPGIYNQLLEPVRVLRIGHGIPADVFAESWTLPPHIALALAQLDNCLSNHATLMDNAESAMISLTIGQRNDFLDRVTASLDAIGRLAREIKDHAGRVSDAVVLARRGH